MKRVKVNLGPRSYNIFIGKGSVKELSSVLKKHPSKTPVFIVTNKKIRRLHGRKLTNTLNRFRKNIRFYEVPDSEKAKSFPVYIKTIKKLAEFSKKIKPIVIAFGGGVIGDLAGFVASTYKRGVPYVQIPTTLLGQVDSSIGGKVAIDTPQAKNITGAFYQPIAVLCDLDLLITLPQSEIRNGMAEVVKYGIIKDKKLFGFIEKNLPDIFRLKAGVIEHIVSNCCRIKARVVEKDELDTSGARAILNFGHTIGHAIETVSGYSGSVTHGAAVGMGMLAANRIALNMNMLNKKDFLRMQEMITTIFPKKALKGVKTKNVLDALSYDKKFISGVNRFILAKKIGLVRIVSHIPDSFIKDAIKGGLL